MHAFLAPRRHLVSSVWALALWGSASCGVASPIVTGPQSQPAGTTSGGSTQNPSSQNNPVPNPSPTDAGNGNSALMGFVRHGHFVVAAMANSHTDALDGRLDRANITQDSATREEQQGTPLALTLTIYNDASGGTPLEGALVDIAQANALGLMSSSPTDGTVGQDFLRGYQLTDAHGQVTFHTIVPGWMHGKAPHINVRVREGSAHYQWTTRLFFDEAVLEDIYRVWPYARHGEQDTRNGQDAAYNLNCMSEGRALPCGKLAQVHLVVDSFGRASSDVDLHLDMSGL